MALYEYKCEGCGEVFEIIQKFTDEPLTIHDKCGGPLHKLVSVSALQFKGSGWYVNDYAKGSAKKGDGGEKKNESSGTASSTTKDSGASSTPASTTTATTDSKSDTK